MEVNIINVDFFRFLNDFMPFNFSTYANEPENNFRNIALE